jgi:hypothetical protein
MPSRARGGEERGLITDAKITPKPDYDGARHDGNVRRSGRWVLVGLSCSGCARFRWGGCAGTIAHGVGRARYGNGKG